jgi:hypothetical protein
MAYEIKRNDRRPRWRVQLLANGLPVDLTAASAARFIMKTGATLKVNRATMTFIDRTNGIVEYPWATGDTDTSGTYTAEVEVDWGGTEYQTFPSSGYFAITISDDLA